ncbi:MAG: HAD-IC family P-type ATPase, partial [Nanoarchaeota archaeon]|nr:HAD-IC family P-type ATPase [Nanoarchaeota archaeon]
LEKLIVSHAVVSREGKPTKILSSELVPGDIIFLEEGDKVPADARIFEEKNFMAQESSLTGESFPQEKSIEVLEENTPLADRTNMVFMGTLIVSGQAKAIVIGTADKTEIGQVAESIQEIVQPKLHFNQKVKQLATQMAIFAGIGALLTFIIGFFINRLEFFEVFLFTIASLVSGIPEGLPAVLVVVLAIGARRMAKKNAVIRHLPAVESLGVATVIAADKTGTITQNTMTVEEIITSEGKFKVTGDGWEPVGRFFQDKKAINPLKTLSLKKLLSISFFCNKASLLRKDGDFEITGDPTEAALLVLGKKAINEKALNEKVIDDSLFNSKLKFRSSLIEEDKKKQIYVVGAFETILKKSKYFFQADQKNLDEKTKKNFLLEAEKLAKKGTRVLALAYRDLPNYTNKTSEKLVNNLTFVGLVGMKDPPRKGIKEAIEKARNAGVRIILKTGDHKETAIAIAKEIGLVKGNAEAFTEKDLERLSEEEFEKVVQRANIFARVTPKMKSKIIQTLQKQGEIVAMTGDGVNDAPALKSADIGISMGIIGTDVARESSEIVLTDDNFSSIVNAVEEGRTVFRNVRRTSFFLITTNVAEDITIVGALAIGAPLPMLPIQLLYLNLVTDTFTGIGLAMEPTHEDVLKVPPKPKKEKILNRDLFPFLILIAVLMALGTIPLFLHYLPEGIEKARTMAFASMSMFQIFNVFNMRSIKRSLFKIGIFKNKWVNLAVIASFVLMLAVLYVPFLQQIFQFVAISFKELLLVILITISIFVAGETYKLIKYKGIRK